MILAAKITLEWKLKKKYDTNVPKPAQFHCKIFKTWGFEWDLKVYIKLSNEGFLKAYIH